MQAVRHKINLRSLGQYEFTTNFYSFFLKIPTPYVGREGILVERLHTTNQFVDGLFGLSITGSRAGYMMFGFHDFISLRLLIKFAKRAP